MKAAILKALFGAIGQVLANLFAQLTSRDTFNKALELAQMHVSALQGNETLDNEQKRVAAVKAMKTDLKAMGLTLRDSLINLAIELAVSNLHALSKK